MFWPCIYSEGTTMFKAQKGIKDIVKIVHVTSVVQSNFIQQFLLFCVSVCAHSREYHNACGCIPLIANKVQGIWILLQNAGSSISSTTCMCHGTLVNTYRRLTGRRRNCWIMSFFVHKMYSGSFMKLRLNHWCHEVYFHDALTTFLDLECGSSVAVYAASGRSQISSEIS